MKNNNVGINNSAVLKSLNLITKQYDNLMSTMGITALNSANPIYNDGFRKIFDSYELMRRQDNARIKSFVSTLASFSQPKFSDSMQNFANSMKLPNNALKSALGLLDIASHNQLTKIDIMNSINAIKINNGLKSAMGLAALEPVNIAYISRFNDIVNAIGMQNTSILKILSSTSDVLSKSFVTDKTISSMDSFVEKITETIPFQLDDDKLSRILSESEFVDEIKNINEGDINLLSEDLEVISGDPLNWQQKIFRCITKWNNKNPVIAFILKYIILSIMISIFAAYVFQAMTIKKSAIREEPNTSAQVIINVNVNQTINVIESKPYYYKIEYYNSETNENVSGWISKRNVTIINNELEEDALD